MNDNYWGAVRTYPKTVKVGDLVCIRKAADGFGYYSDAATVQRSYNGREWATVVSIELISGWYRITTDSTTLNIISSAPNAKVFVRRQKEANAS